MDGSPTLAGNTHTHEYTNLLTTLVDRNTHTHTDRGGGGGGEQGQNAPTRHDEVVHHLGDQMHRVVDKHHVLITVDKVHHRLSGVAVGSGVGEREG